MAGSSRSVSRRAALTGLAAAAACRPGIAGAESCPAAADGDGPVFSPSGPDAGRYGAAEGYPIADSSLPIQPGDPRDPKYFVGAYSHYDEIFSTRRVMRAAVP